MRAVVIAATLSVFVAAPAKAYLVDEYATLMAIAIEFADQNCPDHIVDRNIMLDAIEKSGAKIDVKLYAEQAIRYQDQLKASPASTTCRRLEQQFGLRGSLTPGIMQRFR